MKIITITVMFKQLIIVPCTRDAINFERLQKWAMKYIFNLRYEVITEC